MVIVNLLVSKTSCDHIVVVCLQISGWSLCQEPKLGLIIVILSAKNQVFVGTDNTHTQHWKTHHKARVNTPKTHRKNNNNKKWKRQKPKYWILYVGPLLTSCSATLSSTACEWSPDKSSVLLFHLQDYNCTSTLASYKFKATLCLSSIISQPSGKLAAAYCVSTHWKAVILPTSSSLGGLDPPSEILVQ